MPRTITVTGRGSAQTTPDLVVITLTINSKDKEYAGAMELANNDLSNLRRAITKAGFQEKDLKTANFNVRTFYKDARTKSGEYREVFGGYVVSHELKLEFDFDTTRLSDAVATISGCVSKPELQVVFSVKNPEDVKAKALEEATADAKAKAEVLARAAGATLGTLLSIDYSFGRDSLKSDTNYEAFGVPMNMMAKSGMDFVPEDIRVKDTVTFVWEILT